MRVLIADDHPLYREAAALQIRRLYPDALVGEVSSLPELRQTTADGGAPYDLILLDYHMPGMSPEALVQLVGEFTATPLAVISGTVGQCRHPGRGSCRSSRLHSQDLQPRTFRPGLADIAGRRLKRAG